MNKSDLICTEVLNNDVTLLQSSAVRSAAANQARNAQWDKIGKMVHRRFGEKLSHDQLRTVWSTRKRKVRAVLTQEKSYRNATGGGVDEAIEAILAENRDTWNHVDRRIAEYFAHNPSFLGLRNGESFVLETTPMKTNSGEYSSYSSASKEGHRTQTGYPAKRSEERGDRYSPYAITEGVNRRGRGIESSTSSAPSMGRISRPDPNEFVEESEFVEEDAEERDIDVEYVEAEPPETKIVHQRSLFVSNAAQLSERQAKALDFLSDSDDIIEEEAKPKRRAVSHVELLESQRDMFANMKLVFDRIGVIQSKMLDRLDKMQEVFAHMQSSAAAIPTDVSTVVAAEDINPTQQLPTHSGDSNVDASHFSL